MAVRITLLCTILLLPVFGYAFDEETIRVYELRSEVKANLYAGDDVIYQGDIQILNFRLSDFQVASLNAHELMLLRNAIYAKYGYTFDNETILDHFEQFDWFEPRSNDVSELLNDTDQWNIDLILFYESRLESCETELPGIDEMVGFWHRHPYVASGWSERYFFYSDSRFVFRESQMDGAARLLELSGEWYIEGNHLVLAADSAAYIVGGKIVAPYASYGSDYVIDNGELAYNELCPHEVLRLPLADYTETGEPQGYGSVTIPVLRIGYNQYWRKEDDPERNYLQ